jgi:hypothetical protein
LNKTALLCWEIGESLGHITSLRTIAIALREKGYTCVFALRDLTYGFDLLHAEGFEFFQAPISSTVTTGFDSIGNYAEVLMLVGFLKPKILAAQLLGWRSIYDAVKPSLLVLDSAPTATLAARGLGISQIISSNGFGCPPDSPTWPEFPGPVTFSAERLRKSEKTVLDAANLAASDLGIKSIEHLGQLYPKESTFIASLPELDHYSRIDAHYIGSVAMTSEGVKPNWPITLGAQDQGEVPQRIFAYLKAGFLGLETVLECLTKANVQTIAFIPGLSAQLQMKWNTANLCISVAPVHVEYALTECDLLLSHGGNLMQTALFAGVPLLILPMQTEQVMAAQRVKALGVAEVCPLSSISHFKKVLKLGLSNASLKANAIAFAKRNSNYSNSKLFEAFIEKITNQQC